jgi:hypothetical protein
VGPGYKTRAWKQEARKQVRCTCLDAIRPDIPHMIALPNEMIKIGKAPVHCIS